ncbi:MAG: hypothetical protein GY716_06825, partial [bacterium]|nr:hypothetical protein [bacterium]
TGSASPCSGGSYDDADDLVFAVESASVCTIDDDCDDGDFCNGAETCNTGTGQCEDGTAPNCDDGVSCTDDSCNETTDSCDNVVNNGLCDNGQFCDGAETCDAVNDCQAGTAPACDGGVSCTVDSCNEGTDSCDNTPNNGLCDNGTFCDGAETCDAINDCQSGTPPTCDDGVGCTVDSCNGGTDSCDNVPNNGLCDNGTFCDGAETCDAVNDCQAGGDPCPGQACDEGTDTCVDCVIDADCDNGVFCDGAESCNAGVCQSGTAVDCNDGVSCTVDSCNEGTDSCDNVADDGLCDNGTFCDGAETCDAINDCQTGTAPCTGGQTCDEVNDVCVGGSNPTIWMSFRSNTAVPGVGTVRDEDIVSYDEVTGLWALEFDGSDVGLGSLEISGMAILPSGNLLLSFTAAGTVGGLSIDDSDIVEFTPTSMGPVTAGTFSWYFDGSDVNLTSNGEDVDGIAFHADGRLIVSTTGGFSGSGASGADEDLFLFTGTVGSANTSGSFAQHFDGSDVGQGGNGAEDTDAAAFTNAGVLLLSTSGSFSVPGLTGADEDIVNFTGNFGSATTGTHTMRQDLSALGIASGEDVGSLHIVE